MIGPLIQATFQRAYAAGVKIAFGTDQGVAPHGDNALEFAFMVEAGIAADGRDQERDDGSGKLSARRKTSARSRRASMPISSPCPAIRSRTSRSR